jgi:hypothetical protein
MVLDKRQISGRSTFWWLPMDGDDACFATIRA